MELNEYETNLEKFFKLKKKYYDKIDREKQKIISNNDLTRKEKRLKFNQVALKCINCKNIGGTIFETKKDYFRVVCGNTENPCSLNINFKRLTSQLVDENLIKYIEIISDLKEKIIKIKLDYLLGFITEEESIIQFTTAKKELNDNYEIYIRYVEKYTNTINNIENQDKIKEMLETKNKYILEIKNHIEKYRLNNNISEIREIIELYKGDLEKLIDDINNLKYKEYYIYSNNNLHQLIKEIYSIKDLEI